MLLPFFALYMKKYVNKLLSGAPVTAIVKAMSREEARNFQQFVSKMHLPRGIKRKISRAIKSIDYD